MSINFMRYVIEGAGNIQRLYWAVKIANDTRVDDQKLQWEVFINKYSQNTSLQKGKRGLKRPRSVEPYMSFARELGLLRQRNETRSWLVTIGPGKAFLDIYEKISNKPKYFLIAQLIKNDKTFILPFLKNILNYGLNQVLESSSNLPELVTEKTWKYMWNKYSRQLSILEPTVPKKLTFRTMKHYSDARITLLFKNEGLQLNEDNVKNLISEFNIYENKKLDSDFYLKIGKIFKDSYVNKLSYDDIEDKINHCYYSILDSKYLSAYRMFAFLNEKLLPDCGIDWNDFIKCIRSMNNIQIHTSFTRGDLLFNIKE